MSKPQKARSPYQRYQKAPYQYSVELNSWRRATIARDAKSAAYHNEAWQRRQGWWSTKGLACEPRPPRRHVFPPGVKPYSAQMRPDF